ncbi:MAG: MFS transporter [Acidobacteriota bacterium]
MSRRVSAYTFRYHMRSSLFEGVLNGVFAINDVVARKTLGAGQGLLVLLTMAPSACQLFALLLAPRTVKSNTRRFFFWSGVLGRLILIGMAWVSDSWTFLALLLVNSLVQTAVIPVQNSVFQWNYRAHERGRLFGRATMGLFVVTVTASFLVGHALNRNPLTYRIIYPIAGAAGFVALLLFGRIRVRQKGARDAGTIEIAVAPRRHAIPAALSLLKEDRSFRRFEAAFMVYGLAFMAIQPVMAPFLVDVMRLDYEESAAAKGGIFYVAMAVMTLVAGTLHDRLGIERLGAIAFLLLAAFTASLVVVGSKPAVYVAFALYGCAMACVHVVWTMGPIKYAGTVDAASYMGVHVALVGVRGLLGHPLGGAVAEIFGTPRATFAMASGLFLTATIVMAGLARSTRRAIAILPGPR